MRYYRTIRRSYHDKESENETAEYLRTMAHVCASAAFGDNSTADGKISRGSVRLCIADRECQPSQWWRHKGRWYCTTLLPYLVHCVRLCVGYC